MLEQLADYDDELMEQLLADVQPPRDKVFADLVKELQDGLIVPVLLGSAENGNGILRLLKALRHEAPFVDTHGQAPEAGERQVGGARRSRPCTRRTAARSASCACWPASSAKARWCRAHAPRSAPPRPSPCSGQDAKKRAPAKAGETVALGRLEKILSGETLSAEKGGSIAGPGARAAAAGLRRRHRRQGSQGRGEAHRRAGQADGGGPLAQPGARQGHAPDGAVGPGRDAPARRAGAAQAQVRRGRRVASRASCPTRRPSAKASRRARPAQEAVGRPRPVRRRGASTSSRCRAARASSSPRRSPAAWCRGSSSPRSRSACRTSCSKGRSAASRWSTCR